MKAPDPERLPAVSWLIVFLMAALLAFKLLLLVQILAG